MDGVHALTDVTGFGLLGHLLEICRGSGVAARIEFNKLPLLPAALAIATAGMITGASARNWASYGAEVALGQGIDSARRALLSDPQTSGGLLVACAPEATAAVLSAFRAEGFADARVIGSVSDGPARVEVV
jgi:selenide, water dikinase